MSFVSPFCGDNLHNVLFSCSPPQEGAVVRSLKEMTYNGVAVNLTAPKDYPADAPCNTPLSRLPQRKSMAASQGRGVFIPSFIGSVSEHYTFVRRVGHGSFGQVYEGIPKEDVPKDLKIGTGTVRVNGDSESMRRLCCRPVQQKVAIKVFDLKGPTDQKPGWRDRIVSMFHTEVEVGRSCDHPNLVKLYETYEAYNDSGEPVEIATVMELCEGGDLLDVVVGHPRGIPVNCSRHIIWQICSALRHLHLRGFVHRDLKLENMFFLSPMSTRAWRESTIKIGDFGSVVRVDGPLIRSRGGSPSYLPPEVWKSLGWEPKGDAWAFGVVSYAVLVGSMPFPQPAHVGTDATKSLVVKGEANYTRTSWLALPAEAKDFVQRLLTVNIPDRARVTEICRHRLFENYSEPRGYSAWQVVCATMAWSRLDRFSQLVLQALATSMIDVSVPEASVLFRVLDSSGQGYLGRAKDIAIGVVNYSRTSRNLPPDWEWNDGRDIDPTEYECLEGVSYTGLLAVLLARPDIWFRRVPGQPEFHQYNKAVLRCLVSDQDAILTPADFQTWFPASDRWSACSTTASDSEEGPTARATGHCGSDWSNCDRRASEACMTGSRCNDGKIYLNEVVIAALLEQLNNGESTACYLS